jgi:DtxR family Mn-dependent transcriptional regulator
MTMKLSEQMEDYLEAIGTLSREKGVARVKDVAARLEVTNSSVVGAVKNLKRRKLVQQEPYGYIMLTQRGEELAGQIIHRHQVLERFLEKILGLDREIASHDACRIEHAVSHETVQRLRAMAEFIEREEHDDLDWPREFKKFYRKYTGGGSK